ncbi:MAG: alpha/beta hydrolase [Gammaproteobacteria bacterium]|nr:alpha/beta hydrolase [Gammaproteobacteria bacterium]
MFPDARFVDTNGLRMAVYEQGSGPAIVFLHGFPELAFSWRFQLPALAAAGFRAIAPDLRGYGQTGGPQDVESYCVAELIRDIHGLLDAEGLERAVFVGHDWGAILLWQMAMIAPERIEKIIVLNIPHYPRTPIDPVEHARQRLGDDFYIVNFQDSDEADMAFAADPVHFFNVVMRKNQISRARFDTLPRQMKVLSLLKTMARTESSGDALLSDVERDYFVAAYERSGFTKPINWYRNWTRNWQALEGVDPVINIPTLFFEAVDDVIIMPQHVESMRDLVTNLDIHRLEDCGHWSQQEKPGDVNRVIVDWLTAT